MPKNSPSVSTFCQRPKPPTYPFGGPVYAWQDDAHATKLAEFLRGHVRHDAKGQAFLDDLPDPNRAFVFEGRARQGDDFGFLLWDHHACVWTCARGRRRLSPAILEIKENTTEDKTKVLRVENVRDEGMIPILLPTMYRVSRNWAKGVPIFGEAPDATPEQDRLRAIVASKLLQGLSDRAHADAQGPKIARPDTLVPKYGFVHPAWFHGSLGLTKEARIEHVLALARPILAPLTMDGDRDAFELSGEVVPPTRDGKGNVLPPRVTLRLNKKGPRTIHDLDHQGTYTTRIREAFAAAWSSGRLGHPFHWFARSSDRDPHVWIKASLADLFPSRHALFSALAQART